MAYREFRNEKTYAAPQIEGLPHTLAALDTMARVKAARQQRVFDLQNSWKTFEATNQIPSLNRKINNEARNVTHSLSNAFRAGFNGIPSDIVQRQATLSHQDKEAKAIEEQIKNKSAQIKELASQDPYYKPNYDLQRLMETTRDNDLPISEELASKNNFLSSFSPGQDLRETFDREKAASDFVSSLGKTDKENDYTSPEGVRSRVSTSARFRDKNGVPNITDEHIAQFFGKDKRLYQSYQMDAVDDIAKDWSQYKASGNEKPAWTKGLTDQDVVAELVNDPAKQKDIGVDPKELWSRVADKARNTLKKYEDASVKSFYDQEKQNKGWQFGFTSDKINEPVAGFNTGSYSGPSWTITNKTGANPYLNIDAVTKAKIDPTTGEVNTSRTPTRTVVNNIHWGIYKTDAKGNKIPIPITASNTDEMIEKIRQMPVGERSKISGVAPILNGYSIDKNNLLSTAYTKKDEIETALAKDPTDPEKQNQLQKIEEILDDVNAGRDLNGQLIQRFLGVDIMKPTSFVMEPRDQATSDIRSRTGADLFSDKSMTPEMKTFKQSVDNVIGETKRELSSPEFKQSELNRKGKALKQNVEKITGKIMSDGSDVDKWKEDKQYIVGDATYYFDKTTQEWKKK